MAVGERRYCEPPSPWRLIRLAPPRPPASRHRRAGWRLQEAGQALREGAPRAFRRKSASCRRHDEKDGEACWHPITLASPWPGHRKILALPGLTKSYDIRKIRLVFTRWGLSSAGRARHWQCRGQRFDPARLHQSRFRLRPIRLVVQDTALSRREQGFEPPMGRHFLCVASAPHGFMLSHESL